MEKIIKAAVDRGASDLHIKAGDVFRARIIDLAPDSLTIEITGAEDKIDGLLEVLKPYGVLEMARTGRVAMARGVKTTNGTSPSPLPDAPDSNVSYSV